MSTCQDSQFISIKPSIIAAACVAAALQNISNDFNESDTISDEILGDRIESIRQSTSSTTDYNNQFSMNIVKILRKKFSTTKSMRNLKLPIMFYKMFLITIEQQMGIDSVLLENFIEKIQNLAWSKIGIRLIDYNCYESKRSINKMISSKEESCSVISSFANANIVSELSKISTDQEQHRKLLMLNDEDTTIYTLLPSSQSPPSSQSFDRVKFFLYEDHFVLKPKSWSFF
ncbi:hypothetical protein NH340_JMT02257 [Sarcoptes scabiei]|nr:hypothetical protein NH340_JMT02257 [Sarcoptes scabiei]